MARKLVMAAALAFSVFLVATGAGCGTGGSVPKADTSKIPPGPPLQKKTPGGGGGAGGGGAPGQGNAAQ